MTKNKSDVIVAQLCKKRVVFSIGGKRGVGKSWLICLLIDWYLSKKIKFHAIDLDNENNTLSRFYSEAEFIEVSKERDLDSMIEEIVEGETPITVIDMRAASTDRIEPWLRQIDFTALEQDYGIWFTAVGVVDSSSDSVANIGYWAKDVLGGRKGLKFVVAQNKVRGEELNYPNSKEAAEYRKTLDLIEIEIPKMDEWIHQKLEVADLRIATALEISDPASPLTKFMTKSRLKRYQETVFAEFEKAKEWLSL